MGIKNLLPYLSSISHKVTLRGFDNFKVNEYETDHRNKDEDDYHRIVRKRHLRVGVDISTWISAACHGNGAELLDERHLSNHGRNELSLKKAMKLEENFAGDAATRVPVGGSSPEDLQKEEMARNFIAIATKSVMRKIKSIQHCLSPDIIIVLDGASPPIKIDTVNDRKQVRADAAKERDEVVTILPQKRNLHSMDDHTAASNRRKISAAKKAGATNRVLYAAVVASVLHQLREKAIPFLVSPYEADGQLSFLNQQGLIDYIISEDSDFIPHGAKAVLYKYTTDLPFGDDSDEAYANCCGSATLIRKQDLDAVTVPSFDLTGFTDSMIACMCVASGCDYVRSLKGVGLITARGAVKHAFDKESNKKSNDPTSGGPIHFLLERLFERCKLTDGEKIAYTDSFVRALISFRHPVVFDPTTSNCIYSNIDSPDPDLMSFPAYAKIINDFDSKEKGDGFSLETIVGQLYPKELAENIAQGYINPKTWELRFGEWESPFHVISCLNRWKENRSGIDPAEVIIVD